MSFTIPCKHTLISELIKVERQRDHYRALLADADLNTRFESIEFSDDTSLKAAWEAKIAKRTARRTKEMAEYGTYIRPGPWDDDLDDYQEQSYTESVGDGYSIKLNRHYDGTWNGYVIIPETHPYTNKKYEFFYESSLPRPPVGLTFSNWNMYGFYFGSVRKPYPDYSFFSPGTHYSAEKMEYGGHIGYDSMRKTCLELVEYFRTLVKDTV